MKILMVNKFLYQNGGSETYMIELGEHLSSLGHSIQYFGMEHKDNCVGNNLNCYTSEMDFHNANAISKIKMSLKTIKSNEAMQKIGMVLDDFKPDIVHLNNINFQLTPAIIFEIKKRNIPIVQTVHDVQIACPNHRMYIDHRQEICQKCLDGKYYHCVENKCLHNSFLNSFLATIESYFYHSKDVYNMVDKYICPSNFMKNIIISGGVRKEKTVVMHNFSKIQEQRKSPPDEKYALYFGRISVEKGIDTLVSACQELGDIKFVFAGKGPLFDSIKAKKIPNIELVGFKSGKELEQLIQNAQLTICPSECNENCPMSIIESLALGTPVVSTNLGGAPELIEEGKTGFIFEAGNKDSLVSAISRLYNSNNLEQMRQECAKSSFDNSINNYSQRLLEIYKELRV